jgi:hypothetical protein
VTGEARRDPKTGRWLPGQSGNPAFQWLPGQSGNPAFRFRPGESGNPASRFRPGESGQPASRPTGSRRRLLARFVDDLYRDWDKNGAKAIRTVRRTRPHEYLRAVIAILPKEIKIEHGDEMTDDELDQEIRQLAAALDLALVPAQEPQAR